MTFFSKKKFKKFIDVFYKREYENFLQQDRFWFKSVTWGIIGTTLFGISWLSFAKTDEIVLVPGKIVPIGDVKEIQMPIGGIAKEILVNEGDIVKKGDLLIQLDKESSLAEFTTLIESLKLKERTDAMTDTTTYGQLWVKNEKGVYDRIFPGHVFKVL